MNLLPIPWMKYKLEVIFDCNISGNTFLMYNSNNKDDLIKFDEFYLSNLLENYNIVVDDFHPLYLYLPLELEDYFKPIVDRLNNIYKNNIRIAIGSYEDIYYSNVSKNIFDFNYSLDKSKMYEIFTSLSDTQGILINPLSSVSIYGPTLDYSLKNSNSSNVTHISLVNLLDKSESDKFIEFYLMGLTNKNNNFNYNF